MMNSNIKYLFLLFFTISVSLATEAQIEQKLPEKNIRTIQLYASGNELLPPIYTLGSDQKLTIAFDDLDNKYKNYYYTFILCDYNWKPVQLSQFDYIDGFLQNRITKYRNSSNTLVPYIHYEAVFPERSMVPKKSGNYLLVVSLNGDTTEAVFTKKFIVTEQLAQVAASIVHAAGSNDLEAYQQIRFAVNIEGLNAFSAAQQVKVTLLQNDQWDNAIYNLTPSFVQGNTLQFPIDDRTIFPGGKEWRWSDIRSFSILSDRVANATQTNTGTELYMKPDISRNGQRYINYADLDGNYFIENLQGFQPTWQADYAQVHFYFSPPQNWDTANPIYVAGTFTNYALIPENKMAYNAQRGLYENIQFMKQGYYNYTYIPVMNNKADYNNIFEGNYWETENFYTVLVYYRGFTDRYDRIIGYTQINSRLNRLPFRY